MKPVPNRSVQIATLAWILICGASLGRGAFLYYHLHGRHIGIYPLFEKSGQSWLHARDLYSTNNALDTFRASPLIAAMLAPVSMLPSNIGSVILRSFSLWLYLLGLHRWMRSALGISPGSTAAAAVFLLAIPLSIKVLVDVQTTGAAIGLLLLATAVIPQKRWFTAALLSALSVMLKAYPIGFALTLAAVYPLKFAPRFILATVVLLAIPFLLQRPTYVAGQYHQWVSSGLSYHKGESTPATQPMPSTNAKLKMYSDTPFCDVRILLHLLNVDPSPTQYLLLETATGLAIALLCIRLRCTGIPQCELLTIILGLTCCWMTVFGPATESQTYIFIAPSISYAVYRAFTFPQSRPIRIAIAMAWILGLLSQYPGLVPAVLIPNGMKFADLAPHAIMGLLLMGVLVASTRLYRRSSHQ